MARIFTGKHLFNVFTFYCYDLSLLGLAVAIPRLESCDMTKMSFFFFCILGVFLILKFFYSHRMPKIIIFCVLNDSKPPYCCLAVV